MEHYVKVVSAMKFVSPPIVGFIHVSRHFKFYFRFANSRVANWKTSKFCLSVLFHIPLTVPSMWHTGTQQKLQNVGEAKKFLMSTSKGHKPGGACPYMVSQRVLTVWTAQLIVIELTPHFVIIPMTTLHQRLIP